MKKELTKSFFTVLNFKKYGHFHRLQSANCYRNSRRVVNEDDLKWVANDESILLLLKQF